MKLNFVVRPSKKGKDGTAPIELSIIINGVRKVLTLDKRCKPESFNNQSQKVRGNKELNEYIAAITSKCNYTHLLMIRENIPVTLEKFLDIYKNGYKRQIMMSFAWYEVIKEYRQQHIEGKCVRSTVSKYTTTYDYFLNFVKSTYKKDDIAIEDITANMCSKFYQYLQNKMKNNSAVQKMKCFKSVLQYAVDEGYIKTSPFKVKLHIDKVEHHPLTVGQRQLIQNKEIANERLAKVRDLFVFQCFTGLAYCDMASLTKNNIVDGYIIKTRNKTKVTSTIPLLDNALSILEKYDYQLPILSNQKYNSYLKELGDICGISQDITSHLGRHTCATLMLNMGVQMHTISKVLGHSSTKITESTYAQLRKETIGNEVLKLNALV